MARCPVLYDPTNEEHMQIRNARVTSSSWFPFPRASLGSSSAGDYSKESEGIRPSETKSTERLRRSQRTRSQPHDAGDTVRRRPAWPSRQAQFSAHSPSLGTALDGSTIGLDFRESRGAWHGEDTAVLHSTSPAGQLEESVVASGGGAHTGRVDAGPTFLVRLTGYR